MKRNCYLSHSVSYHVIQKPHTRTIKEKFKANSHSNGLYNNHQPYHMQPYYQQPTAYQSPGYPNPNVPYGRTQTQDATYQGYPNPNVPYGRTQTQDATYQDILQEVTNPLQYSNNPSIMANGQTTLQNDHSLEQVAKKFSKISADMTNMELASLIVYPLSSILGAGKVHKKKHKSKRKHNKERKKNKNIVSKFQSKPKPESVLVHKLIKTEKEKEEEKEMDYDGLPSGDTWDEEDADQGYTSNKRSKITHIKHIMSDSNSDKDSKNSTADEDTSSDEEHNLDKGSGSGARESEFGSGYVDEGDLKEDDSDENKESPELKSDSDETEEQESSGTVVNDNKDKPIGIKESEFGSGYVSENDVQDDDDSKNEKIKPKKKKSD